jgi:LDH2 family malate/lactate/ureidoglycolate dehydrogenase
VGDGIGHFFGAMRVDAFRPAADFKHHMDNWITRFRAAKPIEGQERVLIPGDPEREMSAQRMQTGIPLNPKVVEDLKILGERFGLVLA